MIRDGSRWPVVAAIGTAGLVAVLLFALARSLSPGLGAGVYVLANLILFVDLFDLVVRLWVRRAHASSPDPDGAAPSVELVAAPATRLQRRLHLKPWAMVVSVHDAEPELPRFLHSFAAYRSRLWVIDDSSTDRTVARLRQAGFRVIESDRNRKKPGAIRELLDHLPEEVETVFVLDPDVTVRTADLERVLFEHQRSGMAGLAPRVTVRKDGFLALLQAFEYELCSGIGRKGLADVCTNPGAAVYDRRALAAALGRHSASVYAEDLEISLRLLGDGQGIYYDDRLVLETGGKQTLSAWFSQRVGWFFGLARVYASCLPAIRRLARRSWVAAYQYVGYAGILNLLAHPLRVACVVVLALSACSGLGVLLGLGALPGGRFTDPVLFPIVYLQYFLFALIALLAGVPRTARRALLPVVPVYFFYTLLGVVPATVGYLNWLTLRFAGRRVFVDHYQDEAGARRAMARSRVREATT